MSHNSRKKCHNRVSIWDSGMGDDCEGSVNPNEVMSVSEGVLAGWWPKPRRHGIGWIIPYLFNSPQWGSCSTMARIWRPMACLKDSGLVYSKPHKNKKSSSCLVIHSHVKCRWRCLHMFLCGSSVLSFFLQWLAQFLTRCRKL